MHKLESKVKDCELFAACFNPTQQILEWYLKFQPYFLPTLRSEIFTSDAIISQVIPTGSVNNRLNSSGNYIYHLL